MKAVLHIDTSNREKTLVVITVNGVKKEYSQETNQETRSQNVLNLVEEVLQNERLQVTDLTAIEVDCGPGSFTGTRVGVTVVNALGWALGISVNGKHIATPVYQASKFDTFGDAKLRALARRKKRRLVSTLSIPRFLNRGVEWVD